MLKVTISRTPREWHLGSMIQVDGGAWQKHSGWFDAFGDDHNLMGCIGWTLNQRRGLTVIGAKLELSSNDIFTDYWPQWIIAGVFGLSLIAMWRDTRRKRRPARLPIPNIDNPEVESITVTASTGDVS